MGLYTTVIRSSLNVLFLIVMLIQFKISTDCAWQNARLLNFLSLELKMTEKLLKAFSMFTVFWLSTSYVSVKHMMSELNNVPVLAISMACLFNERVFKRLIINECFSGYFVKIGINGWCNFSGSYSSSAATLVFIKALLYDPVKYDPSKFVMRLNATYNCPCWNAFCLHKFRLTTAFDKLIPCNLWTLHAYDSVNGNCVGVTAT